tara:strand:+ start:238 stop:516 length:279 start_codon:yes stop_codon:yes gene_type:complete
MDRIIDCIGLVSAVLIAIMFVPQIVHVYKTKDTDALNYTFLGTNIVASILGLVYSIYYTVIPMIVANTSAGLFSVSLITMKQVNGLKEQSPV